VAKTKKKNQTKQPKGSKESSTSLSKKNYLKIKNEGALRATGSRGTLAVEASYHLPPRVNQICHDGAKDKVRLANVREVEQCE